MSLRRASPKVEEKVEFDMNEAERKNEYDPSSCPQEYLPIIEKLEEIEIQPDEYYLWYKKLSRALLFRCSGGSSVVRIGQ